MLSQLFLGEEVKEISCVSVIKYFLSFPSKKSLYFPLRAFISPSNKMDPREVNREMSFSSSSERSTEK